MEPTEDQGRLDLAAAVTSARRAKRWSRAQAAREAGMSPITYDKVEEGEPVREATLHSIEAAFGWPAGRAFAILEGQDITVTEVEQETPGLQTIVAAYTELAPRDRAILENLALSLLDPLGQRPPKS